MNRVIDFDEMTLEQLFMLQEETMRQIKIRCNKHHKIKEQSRQRFNDEGVIKIYSINERY